MAVRLKPSKFKTGNPFPRTNNAHSAKPLTNTCTTTTVKNAHNCFAKFACLFFKPTIVIKERLKPNITARIATAHCSAGKCVSTSLCTNAATITANTESAHSNNSTPQNKTSGNQNLHNSNLITFTANTCSKPKTLSCHHP